MGVSLTAIDELERRRPKRRVFILGLDSMPPNVLYERPELFPFLSGVLDDSSRYILRTCYPPITVPAWLCMFTGMTPGELGIYDFKHRRKGSYDSYIVTSMHVSEEPIWQVLGKRGFRVGIYGVPPTYPPRPLNGFLVSDLTTPGPDRPYTFPPWLKAELESAVGPTIFDIAYRRWEKDEVIRDLFKMLENHQRQVAYLTTRKRWDIFIYVEIATDRAHHAFWRYFDKEHPRHEVNEKFGNVIPRLYRAIDEWVERLFDVFTKDAIFIVVSDHGTKAMHGCLAINQWLIEQEYLRLKVDLKELKPGTQLTPDLVDWERTIAWAWGGYFAAIFINVKGREEKGAVEPRHYDDVVKQLKDELSRIKGPNGEQWKNEVYTPYELYPIVRGDAPDIMAFFDDLKWRPIGSIGWDSIYVSENDIGPDDAVHDWYGVLAIYDPEETVERGFRGTVDITNVAHMLIDLIGRR